MLVVLGLSQEEGFLKLQLDSLGLFDLCVLVQSGVFSQQSCDPFCINKPLNLFN